MESKFFSTRLNTLLLALFMFFDTALHEENRILLYLCATVAVSIVPMWDVILYSKLLVQTINSKFFLWIASFMCFIMVDAFLRKQYSEFPFRYEIFVWATICIFLVILHELDDPSLMIKIFCKACLWSLIAVVVCILIMEKDSIAGGHIRIGSSMSSNSVNLVGIHLGIYSLGILFMYIQIKKKLLLVPYFIAVVFMLLTGSKKVFFPIMLGIAMYELCGGIRVKKVFVLFISLAMLTFIILNNTYLYNVIGSRGIAFLGNIGVLESASDIVDNSTSIRKQLIITAWQLFLEKPILGWGYNITARVVPWHFYSHNNYVELLANNGIVGFLLYYGMYFVLLWKSFCLSKKNPNRYFLLALLLNSLLLDIGAVRYTSGLMTYVPPMVASVYLLKEKRRMRCKEFAQRSALTDE